MEWIKKLIIRYKRTSINIEYFSGEITAGEALEKHRLLDK
jgi:hypothetical protein